jgi:hypothetical protein
MSKITRALEELAKRSSEGKVVPDKVSDAIDLLTGRAVNGDAVAEAELLRFDPRFDPRKLEKDRLGALKVDFNQTRPDPPRVPLSQFEGENFVTSMTDRTRALGNIEGINDVKFREPVKAHGGYGFMFDGNKGVWSSASGAVTAIMNKARALGDNPLIIPHRMSPKGGDFAVPTGEVMLMYAQANMTKGVKANLNRSMKTFIPDWKGIDNPESIQQYRMQPDKIRKPIQAMMDKGYRNLGGLSIGEARLANTDPSQLYAKDGGIQNVGRIFTGDEPMPSNNPTYSTEVPGEGIGMIDAPEVSILDLLPEDVARDYFKYTPGEALTNLQGYLLRLAPQTGTMTEGVLRALENRGINISSAAGVSIMGTLLAAGLLTPQEVQAGPIKEAISKGIKLFHGSPHDFPPVRELEMPDGAVVYQSMDDAVPEGAQVIAEHPLGRFDMSKLGTGEGAQAYGRGLYFAESEDVARQYKNNLSRLRKEATIGGEPIDDPVLRAAIEITSFDDGTVDIGEAIKFAEDNARVSSGKSSLAWQAAADKMRGVNPNEVRVNNPGRMYEVNIDATPDDFLDYDLPLSQQSDKVRSSVSGMLKSKGFDDSQIQAIIDRDIDGQELNAMLGSFDESKGVKHMTGQGIKGIRYKDGFSRGADGGSSNYVVFDDKLIDITKKYGVGPVAAAAILAGSMTPEEAQAGPISSGIKRLASAYEKVASPQAEGVARMVEQGQISPEQADKYTNTIKAYKLFRTKGGNTDELFPLFVNANKPVNMGEWNPAESGLLTDAGKVKSSIGPLAYRPGWHAGDAPVATHIGGKSDSSLKAPDYRPADQVWAEVEMPADVDWQSVADSRMEYSKAGNPIPRTAQITDQIPEGGYYRYKTNPNMTGDWLIAGDMKVNRVLTPSEVYQINAERGVHDLPPVDDNGKMLWSLALGSGLTAAGIAPEEAKADLLSEVPQEQAQQLQDNWSQIEANAQAGMGGMGVRSAPVTQDEEAIIAAQQPAPTGADLMQQANDDFLSGIFNQPGSFFNPETYDVIGDVGRGAFDATTGFLGDMEQMLVGGIMQGIGGATTWEDALKMIGGGLGQGIINAPEGRGSRFMEGMKNYDPAFITSGEVGQVPGMIPSFGTQDEERTKRAKMLGGFFAPI